MIKILTGLLLCTAALSGCASKHYIEQQAGTLLFSLRLPEATRVQFSSSLDNYVLHDSRRNSSGDWQITVPTGEEMKYFYIVDGAVFIPECQLLETDDFGSKNCLYRPGAVTF